MITATSFCSLPEDCISTILSLATPRDVARCSLISSLVRYAAESNVAWYRFLPSDYQEILSSGNISPGQFSSRKELYFRLCDPILIDGGIKNFWLEKSTGRKCYMLSAKELSIPWANDPTQWCWKPVPQSRFSEATELRMTSWLEIQGKINARALSPETTYSAHLVFRIADRAYGLDSIPCEISIQIKDHICAGTAYLHRRDSKKQRLEHLYFLNRIQMLKSRVIEGDGRVPCERDDGWMEIELGEFYSSRGDEGEVKMSLMEVKGEHLKGGLIVEGIEVRPRSQGTQVCKL